MSSYEFGTFAFLGYLLVLVSIFSHYSKQNIGLSGIDVMCLPAAYIGSHACDWSQPMLDWL